MKKKIFKYNFSPPYLFFFGGGGGGRENKSKYIFTPVYWGEKIYLNIFSLLFIGERKNI